MTHEDGGLVAGRAPALARLDTAELMALVYCTPTPQPRRDVEVAAVRRYLEREGIRELATAAWPPSEEGGGVFVIVLAASGEAGDRLAKRLELTIERRGLHAAS